MKGIMKITIPADSKAREINEYRAKGYEVTLALDSNMVD